MKAPSHPAAKAVWFIENHFDKPLTLDDIALAAGVSRYHLTRVFDTRMGLPVMHYVRGRRLTAAAMALKAGAPDILSVALAAGYGSHEAFTRAFRDRFGTTPEAVREQGDTATLDLQEPILMDTNIIDTASSHVLKAGRAMRIAGLSNRYNAAETAAIPSLWQAFGAYLPDVPGRTGEAGTAYGVCYNQTDDGIDYMAGVEVDAYADLPPAFRTINLSSQTYAVFLHSGHISAIRSTWATIWDKWLPESGLSVLPAPFFEKYGPGFDGRTGNGGLEIWIPIKT